MSKKPQRTTAKTARPPGRARAYPVPVPAGTGRAPFPWHIALPLAAVLILFTFMALSGRQQARVQVIHVPGGDPARGRLAIQSWGCGSCHTIPGIPGAYGKVGPELDQMAEQTYVAGFLPNTPDNLIRWIMIPQELHPGNAMPNTGVTEPMARDMAAYLYSLRSTDR